MVKFGSARTLYLDDELWDQPREANERLRRRVQGPN